MPPALPESGRLPPQMKHKNAISNSISYSEVRDMLGNFMFVISLFFLSYSILYLIILIYMSIDDYTYSRFKM